MNDADQSEKQNLIGLLFATSVRKSTQFYFCAVLLVYVFCYFIVFVYINDMQNKTNCDWSDYMTAKRLLSKATFTQQRFQAKTGNFGVLKMQCFKKLVSNASF